MHSYVQLETYTDRLDVRGRQTRKIWPATLESEKEKDASFSARFFITFTADETWVHLLDHPPRDDVHRVRICGWSNNRHVVAHKIRSPNEKIFAQAEILHYLIRSISVLGNIFNEFDTDSTIRILDADQ